MNKRLHTVPCVLLLALVVAASGPSGCSPESRFGVLSSLFDGVTHPDSMSTREKAEARAAQRAAVDSLRNSSAEQVAALQLVIHPPYADGDCTVCHESGDSGSFSGTATLVAPVTELCITCHDDVEVETLREEHAWVHGPVAAGACTSCHNPHQTTFPSLLLAAPERDLCIRCHTGASGPSQKNHSTVAERSCLDCHAPHSADGRSLPEMGMHLEVLPEMRLTLVSRTGSL